MGGGLWGRVWLCEMGLDVGGVGGVGMSGCGVHGRVCVRG